MTNQIQFYHCDDCSYILARDKIMSIWQEHHDTVDGSEQLTWKMVEDTTPILWLTRSERLPGSIGGNTVEIKADVRMGTLLCITVPQGVSNPLSCVLRVSGVTWKWPGAMWRMALSIYVPKLSMTPSASLVLDLTKESDPISRNLCEMLLSLKQMSMFIHTHLICY